MKVRELDHPLVAILEPSEGGCRLVRLFHDESDSQTDWYDNSQHKAYVDVTDQVSGTPEEQHLVSEIMNRLGTIDG